MPASEQPLVTLSIPLYRSAEFVPGILANLAQTYPRLEILISDRHQDDDAIERLRRALAGDPRVRILATRDRAGWVPNYESLMAQATGALHCFMPHDDHFAPDWVERLVGALEREPRALVAFGTLDRFADPPRELGSLRSALPEDLESASDWNAERAVRLLHRYPLWVAFRGLFRLDRLRELDLLFSTRSGDRAADLNYCFEVALAGAFVFEPGTRCLKLIRDGSTSHSWGATNIRSVLDHRRHLREALERRVPNARLRRRLLRLVDLHILYDSGGMLRRLVPRPVGRPLRRAFESVLRWSTLRS